MLTSGPDYKMYGKTPSCEPPQFYIDCGSAGLLQCSGQINLLMMNTIKCL